MPVLASSDDRATIAKLTGVSRRITLFDRMRLHYVAFSRSEKLLVLTSHTQPRGHFAPIWQGLPQWPYVQKDLLAAQSFVLKDRLPVKRAFSFTGDLKVYCRGHVS